MPWWSSTCMQGRQIRYVLSLDDVHAGSSGMDAYARRFVAMRTIGQALAGRSGARQQGRPGCSIIRLEHAGLKLLYEERGITAPGTRHRHRSWSRDHKDDYSLESYILGTNHYQIEMLANLDQVPSPGAVWITFPRSRTARDSPRVIAVVP